MTLLDASPVQSDFDTLLNEPRRRSAPRHVLGNILTYKRRYDNFGCAILNSINFIKSVYNNMFSQFGNAGLVIGIVYVVFGQWQSFVPVRGFEKWCQVHAGSL